MSIKIKSFIIFLLCSLVFSDYSYSQFYSTGQDPASAKWMQINTDNFQIIFQVDFEDQAQKTANILEYYYSKVGQSLNHKPKKISVVIHNQTITSNGYVAWAPKRMELYATPPQDIYPDPWLEHLCIHELRHVVQLDKLNQGITKILSLVFGQQATGLVAGQLPLWYLEGDAVCTETAFTKFGRGRLPFFEKEIKTHLLSDENRYSFDKMLFGSYRSYIPDHYELGYQLTAYTRSKYGVNAWNKVHNHVAKNSYTLLPTTFAFYRGLKKNIGLSQEELFVEAFDYLDSTWTIEKNAEKTIEPKYFQKYSIPDYENYINPVFIDNEKILALKKGMSHIPQFVLVNENSEKVLHEPGYLISEDFSYKKNLIVWVEYKPDIRWQNREYTSIKLLNLKTNFQHTLIKKSRYFSPDFSKNAQTIAVIEVDEKNKTTLVLLNAYNGKVIKAVNSPGNHFIQRPKWSPDNEWIYVIELTGNGKQVSRYNLLKDKWQTVFEMQNADIQRILPAHDNKVYFHSTLNGTDNIYVFDENNHEIYQISASKYGIPEFDLDTNKNELITNEYTSRGHRLATIPVERALWKNIDKNKHYQYKFAEAVTKQESIENTPIVQKEHQVKPYKKPFHLFNFHSWIPAFVDYENMSIGSAITDPSEIYNNIHPGIMLLSQNKLSTTESILSYGYKNGNHYLSSLLKFKGQYPVVTLSANYGDNQLIQTTSDATWYPESKIGYSYDLDIYVPLNFSNGKFIKGFRPLISVEYFDNIYYNYQKDYYIKGLEFVQTQLLFYSYQYKAERDIVPQLGSIFTFNLLNTPFESELFGYMYNVDATFYLPGGKNRGIKLDLGYQYQKPNLYILNSNFNFPRGILKKRSEKMVKLYSDYIFPIAYPDWNLGSLLYIKRLRGDIFLDYAYNTYKTVNQARTAYIWPIDHNFSFGFEFSMDYHLLRMNFPLNSGVRLGFAPTEGDPVIEFLFGIDLYSF